LVPDSPNAWTSDHGWDINKDATRLIPVINELKKLGIRVSLFMDPDPEAIELAVSLGIDRIELYTEPYAKAFATDLESAVLSKYVESASVAQSSGVLINAGHDLNLINLFKFLNTVENVQEVSIGHALIADALVLGLDAAVKKYLLLMKSC
jgi:pyridoxine 5-phosphate synthase